MRLQVSSSHLLPHPIADVARHFGQLRQPENLPRVPLRITGAIPRPPALPCVPRAIRFMPAPPGFGIATAFRIQPASESRNSRATRRRHPDTRDAAHGPPGDLLVLPAVIAHARTFAGGGRIVGNGGELRIITQSPGPLPSARRVRQPPGFVPQVPASSPCRSHQTTSPSLPSIPTSCGTTWRTP